MSCLAVAHTIELDARYALLSDEAHRRQLCLETHLVSSNDQDFSQLIHPQQRKIDSWRLEGELAEVWVQNQRESTLASSQLGFADCLQRLPDGGWVGGTQLVPAVRAAVVRHGQSLDFSGDVLVVGSNHKARAAVMALFQLGFSQFYILDPLHSHLDESWQNLQSVLFSIELNTVDVDTVMALPGTISLLSLNGSRQCETELSYFNYLKPGGWIIEMFDQPDTSITKEALALKMNIIPGAEVWAIWDQLFLARANNELNLNWHQVHELSQTYRTSGA